MQWLQGLEKQWEGVYLKRQRVLQKLAPTLPGESHLPLALFSDVHPKNTGFPRLGPLASHIC